VSGDAISAVGWTLALVGAGLVVAVTTMTVLLVWPR
jgi:hypothetical protein